MLTVVMVSGLLVGACSDDAGDDVTATVPSSVLAEAPAASTTTEVGATAHNEADVRFAQAMIPHHQGAIEMAELALANTTSEAVRDLATRINQAQGPEIEQLRGSLEAWGAAEGGGMAGMDHGADGAASDPMMTENMAALEAASGAEFDRLFLTLMIEHHRGAIEMAQDEAEHGQAPEAIAMAEQIIAAQQAEIDEMQTLLTTG